MSAHDRIIWFSDLGRADIGTVGGKNASLGELIRMLTPAGIRVPGGFATTAAAYYELLAVGGLRERVAEQIKRLHQGGDLAAVGRAIREAFVGTELPAGPARSIIDAYRRLGAELGRRDPDVAVRSSATAEDLPEASFAGQQESFLNVSGEKALLEACKRCYASLFTDRAINYREELGFDHLKVALSIGVQLMVRSDLAGAGVAFSIDTETGFPRSVLINASWGLGETVVGGLVDPDEYLVFKPLLDRSELCPILSKTRGRKQRKIIYADDADARAGARTRTVDTDQDERTRYVLDDEEIVILARWVSAIERHYGVAMDVEWAKDGRTGELFIVQARPETVQARREATLLRSYRLRTSGERLIDGLAIGDAIATGRVCVLRSAAEIDRFTPGSVLVTEITDPDWEPVMKQAAAIVTDHGGRTSHAAIVSRELGVPAIVGTACATTTLLDGQQVTVSCAEGDQGVVYDGICDFEERELDLAVIPRTKTRVMLNLANPAAAFRWWRLPADGVGLTRIEFVVNNHVKIHPMALIRPADVDEAVRRRIAELTRGYDDKTEYFVERLAYGVARIAASRWPDPVVVRMSDFKTNEYARLIGGRRFEPAEENPMLGWRGASRYYSDAYRDGFALECRAIRRIRDGMGLTNVIVMIPFCRTVEEADQVLKVMSENGLGRGQNGLQIYVMAEIPANIILAELFAERFDGFSIGSNDLTQLTLGVDRDSAALAHLFDERNPAVIRSVRHLIATAHAGHCTVGLCGQRPSDDPDFARILVGAGIDSISVTPDSFRIVKQNVAAAEAERAQDLRP